MAKDHLFAVPKPMATDFAFDAQTAAVFDDMLGRSVPYYAEIQRMIAELATEFAVPGTNVYDLGCSTGATLRNLRAIDKAVNFIGIDSSPEMLARAEAEFRAAKFDRPYELRAQDLHEGLGIENASVVILCLTLQFVRPLHREKIMKDIFAGMLRQGCLILVEKVLGEETLLNRLFIKFYYEMKRRNGYSDLEIAQKREALENILIPYRLEENRQLLRDAGFRDIEIFFKWYNFCGLVAVK